MQWSLQLGRWTATTVQKTTQKQKQIEYLNIAVHLCVHFGRLIYIYIWGVMLDSVWYRPYFELSNFFESPFYFIWSICSKLYNLALVIFLSTLNQPNFCKSSMCWGSIFHTKGVRHHSLTLQVNYIIYMWYLHVVTLILDLVWFIANSNVWFMYENVILQ